MRQVCGPQALAWLFAMRWFFQMELAISNVEKGTNRFCSLHAWFTN